MARPLLETKLYVPRPRPGVLPRPRLARLLERGSKSRLTVVSAPPGFGKSTLVADWLASTTSSGHDLAAAWVSLDHGDDDVRSFWTYVITALERASMVGDAASALLELNTLPVESVLATLLNTLGDGAGNVLLVLDDYHLIERSEIHEGVSFLLAHLPPHVRVILITRADPPLPLARLRARGDLVEIRAVDLRFTTDEAEAYLNGSMELALTSNDVATLEGRTEGWIAALQLAALSIGGRVGADAFIAEFAGDDRYIVDYLVEEVLDRQPEHIRRFLLDTSILDRLTGALCNAVTATEDGSRTLEFLERANLFLIALDDRRRWYRYHHLFADVLRARTLAEQPDALPILHRRASAWFEAEGDLSAAIQHALAAHDPSRAADLIERAADDLFARRHEMALRRWLDALPESTFESRPSLAIMHAATLLSTGEATRVEERLATAERAVSLADNEVNGAAVGHLATDRAPAIGRPLTSAIALHRAGLARMRGDASRTVLHAEAALAAAGADQPLERGGASGLLALAYWSDGDLDAAFQAWTESFENLAAAGRMADLVGLSTSMADIRVTQGRLREAQSILERGLRIAMQSEASPLRGTADMHVGLAEIDLERNDLARAKAHLEAADALGEALGLPQHPHRVRVARAQVAVAEADVDAAARWLDEAERRYDADFHPNVRPIAALRARVRIRHGRLADARAWVAGAGIAEDDELSFGREFEHATLARLLLAEGVRDRDREAIRAATRLANRLLSPALEGGRHGSAIDLWVVLALAAYAGNDAASASEHLDRAIAVAEPEGWVRVFLDEGDPMAELLVAIGSPDGSPPYRAALRAAAHAERPDGRAQHGLVEPLTEREMDVLRLFRSDLNGPEIARELHVSLNTVRTHTKSVYAKLGVNSRRSAVRRADELGLASRRRPATT